MQITGGEHQPGKYFHRQIAGRNGVMAPTAASPKHEPAKNRYVLVQWDHSPAVWTGRTRRNYRFTPRQPIDTHIQKAAEDQPQGKRRDNEQRVHLCFKRQGRKRVPRTVAKRPISLEL